MRHAYWLLAASIIILAPAAIIQAQASELVRPEIGDFEQRIGLLFDAIVHDDPARAIDVFFPRAAFVQVKAMRHPERYYARLLARFHSDIHELHASLVRPEQARFERFELARRGGLVAPGVEGNRMPYWASRHSWLHYRVGDVPRKLEVRVAITWADRWYVIHLSEFR